MKDEIKTNLKQSYSFKLKKQKMLEEKWQVQHNNKSIGRLLTGISGFDEVLEGGIPKCRSLLITGGTGCGKTIFLNEFIYRGITKYGQNGVFVTFEERPSDIKQNMASFGWYFDDLEKENKLAFVDGSPEEIITKQGQQYDWLDAITTRIEHAVDKTGAKRIAIDSIGTIFGRYTEFSNEAKIRDGIFLLVDKLKKLGLTILISAEKMDIDNSLSRHGIEEFVSDGVVDLEVIMGQNKILRKLIIRKIRGIGFRSGHVEFEITNNGITVYPKIPVSTKVAKTDFDKRKKLGIVSLDKAMGGGIPQGHMTLIGGNTGTGKTIFGMHFIAEGINENENAVWVALEEPIPQVKKTAAAHGWDFEKAENEGKLKFVHSQLIDISSDKLLYNIIDAVMEIDAKRVVIDSISSLASATMDHDKVREFLLQASYYFKANGLVCVMNYLTADSFSASSGQLMGQMTTNEMRMSSIVDAIIILRYVEQNQQVKKLLNILKLRGSHHIKDILQYDIQKGGIVLGKRFGIVE